MSKDIGYSLVGFPSDKCIWFYRLSLTPISGEKPQVNIGTDTQNSVQQQLDSTPIILHIPNPLLKNVKISNSEINANNDIFPGVPAPEGPRSAFLLASLVKQNSLKSSGQITLGRKSDNSLVIKLKCVSGRHCIISWKPTIDNTNGNDDFSSNLSFDITDSSTNGTYVNGARLSKGQKQILKHEDKISFSVSEFTYQIGIKAVPVPDGMNEKVRNSISTNEHSCEDIGHETDLTETNKDKIQIDYEFDDVICSSGKSISQNNNDNNNNKRNSNIITTPISSNKRSSIASIAYSPVSETTSRVAGKLAVELATIADENARLDSRIKTLETQLKQAQNNSNVALQKVNEECSSLKKRLDRADSRLAVAEEDKEKYQTELSKICKERDEINININNLSVENKHKDSVIIQLKEVNSRQCMQVHEGQNQLRNCQKLLENEKYLNEQLMLEKERVNKRNEELEKQVQEVKNFQKHLILKIEMNNKILKQFRDVVGGLGNQFNILYKLSEDIKLNDISENIENIEINGCIAMVNTQETDQINDNSQESQKSILNNPTINISKRERYSDSNEHSYNDGKRLKMQPENNENNNTNNDNVHPNEELLDDLLGSDRRDSLEDILGLQPSIGTSSSSSTLRNNTKQNSTSNIIEIEKKEIAEAKLISETFQFEDVVYSQAQNDQVNNQSTTIDNSQQSEKVYNSQQNASNDFLQKLLLVD